MLKKVIVELNICQESFHYFLKINENRETFLSLDFCYTVCTVKPLLKDTPNKGHNIFNLSIMDKFYGPYGTIKYNFASEKGQPLYNSKIRPKIVGPQVSVI